jgi:hypothetical protein
MAAEVQQFVQDRFYMKTTENYKTGIQRLVTQWDACLSVHCDYSLPE